LLVWWHYRSQRRLEKQLRQLNFPSLKFPTIERLGSVIESQQQSFQLLEQQLSAWQQVLYAAPFAYLQVDEANQLVWLNPKAEQLLGIDRRRSAESQHRRFLLQIVRSYELDQLIDRTRLSQLACQQEWLYHAPLASHRGQPLRGYGLPLALGEVGVFLEDRREAVQLKAERERWTSDVAHELKTPLTSIRLVAETLQSRLDPGLRIWADRLLKETLRLSTLVQDLLELSRLTLTLTPESITTQIDLPALLQGVWANLEPLASQKDVQLDYHGPAHWKIEASESQLFRVLLNLLDNAIRYSPTHTSIHVKLSSASPDALSQLGLDPQGVDSSNWLQLEVIDTGPGFSPDDLSQVFERFYRGEASRVRSPDQSTTGSGLGLAIVQQIIAAHGGRVTANNHPETGGGWLQVFLPQVSDLTPAQT
jgi:two-component system phosphate regulon sensor histidine kinase PhoR